MILAFSLTLGILIVVIGILMVQSRDSDSDASPTVTPEIAGSDEPEPTANSSDSSELQLEAEATTPEAGVEPTVTPDSASPEPVSTEVAEVPQQEPLTEDELQQYQPNELGQVMVLMYHRIATEVSPEDVWSRTPDQFRSDLQWLYDNNFYIIPIRDYIRNEINAPAGKRPVVLTFDDGTDGQFRLLEADDGSMVIDPNSAIGILEEFLARYDDFGRGGLFSILPNAPFAWPDAEDQRQYAEQKLQWMLENGYELGNHTVGHINMIESDDEMIKSELARAEDMITGFAPEAEISVLAVPFGMYPEGGDTSIFEGWEFEGRQYELEGALMVGAEPAPSPVHIDFDPMWIPRINGDDSELGRWFSFAEENPGIIYVSDGNPHTVTVPAETHPWLVDTLNADLDESKTIIRY